MKKYRIFMAIGGKASPGDNNNIWVRNLYQPLVDLGHDVFLLNIDDFAEAHGLGYMSPEARERLSNELPQIFLKEHSAKPFDIFFSYLHNGQIIPQVLKEIKKNVYTINYSTNYHQFDMYREVAGIVDCNIYYTKIAREGYDSIGVKSYWMPLAANPKFYYPSKAKNQDTVFVGSAYGPRPNFFWRLLQYDINLQLYGHGWVLNERSKVNSQKYRTKRTANNLISRITGYELQKHNRTLEDDIRSNYERLNSTILNVIRRDFPLQIHPSLDDESYVKVLSEAAIVINIQESRYNHDYFNHQVLFTTNLRDYEATMCKSFLCTQYSDEITELFEVGKEVICFHNEHDLADKVKYYTKNTSERDRIAESGYLRSIQNHTWERRFTDFFEYLKL